MNLKVICIAVVAIVAIGSAGAFIVINNDDPSTDTVSVIRESIVDNKNSDVAKTPNLTSDISDIYRGYYDRKIFLEIASVDNAPIATLMSTGGDGYSKKMSYNSIDTVLNSIESTTSRLLTSISTINQENRSAYTHSIDIGLEAGGGGFGWGVSGFVEAGFEWSDEQTRSISDSTQTTNEYKNAIREECSSTTEVRREITVNTVSGKYYDWVFTSSVHIYEIIEIGDDNNLESISFMIARSGLYDFVFESDTPNWFNYRTINEPITCILSDAQINAAIDYCIDRYGISPVDNTPVAPPESFIPSGYNAISSFNDLKNISNDTSGRYFLMNDIDVSDRLWTPINGFRGVFDGNGHSVTGLAIASCGGGGLFSNINNGKVLNLTVNADITYNPCGDGDEYVDIGIIAGYVENGSSIKNCAVYGNLSKSNTKGHTFAGGICGRINGSSIESCISHVAINVTAGWVNAGGIVGEASNSTVQSCVHQSEINTCARNECNSGGIVGQMWSNSLISKCVSAGTVKAENRDTKFLIETGYRDTGGISGRNYGSTISDCYAETGKLFEGNSSQSDKASDGGNNKKGESATFLDYSSLKSARLYDGWRLDNTSEGLPRLLSGEMKPRDY